MDERRFDALTRALAEGASRRNVLKALLGGAGALVGSAAVKQTASAQTCPDPSLGCAPDNGPNEAGCACNGGAGICSGGFCIECRIGFNDDCLVTQGAGLCNDSGTNLCECVAGAQGNVCQLVSTGSTEPPTSTTEGPPTSTTEGPSTSTTEDPCASGTGCAASGGTTPDGCPCGEGATCHGGYCCFDWQICGDVCCDGDSECVACEGGACTLINQMGDCNGGAGVCCDQYCVTLEECCPPFEGQTCTATPGGTIPDRCPCGEGATCHGGYCCFDWQICGDVCCDGDSECVACEGGACTLINQMGDCNGGPSGGGGVCCDQYCVTLEECCPPFEGQTCTATPGGTIPDRCPCGEGATCHGGYCCFDWQICGDVCCEGDDECISCVNGTCLLINQYGSCNGGAGVCCEQYCIEPENCCPEGGCRDCETCWNGTCIEDCPDCESCNDLGACATDCEPEDHCTSYTCVNGACSYDGCEENETCCGFNSGSYCADLYSDDRYNCGECGWECDGCEVCLNGLCIETDACCGTFGESCGDSPEVAVGGETQLDCCEGLLCCHGDPPGDDDDDDDEGPAMGGESMYCAECCNDHHCDKGYHCCYGRCIPDDVCCTDRDCDDCEECRQGECVLTGVPFGEYCGMIGLAEGESPQLDCCDGLVCCEVDKDGNRCFECCGDWDCPKGAECKHGVCEFDCQHDKDCPDHTCCCKSGHCSKHCCDDHKKPEKPQKPGEPGVDTLPSTGSGDTASGAGWLGAAALGAAAFAVGKTLRDGATPVPEARSEE